MKRWYVTMTWDNFPEGGSFGTIVEAEDAEKAEQLCRQEMVDARMEEWADGIEEYDEEGFEAARAEFEEDYGSAWKLIDCFDLDEFIERHKR